MTTGITKIARITSLRPLTSDGCGAGPNSSGRLCDIVLAIDDDVRCGVDGHRLVRAPRIVRVVSNVPDRCIVRYSTGVARVLVRVDHDDPDRVVIDSSSLTTGLRSVPPHGGRNGHTGSPGRRDRETGHVVITDYGA